MVTGVAGWVEMRVMLLWVGVVRGKANMGCFVEMNCGLEEVFDVLEEGKHSFGEDSYRGVGV